VQALQLVCRAWRRAPLAAGLWHAVLVAQFPDVVMDGVVGGVQLTCPDDAAAKERAWRVCCNCYAAESVHHKIRRSWPFVRPWRQLDAADQVVLERDYRFALSVRTPDGALMLRSTFHLGPREWSPLGEFSGTHKATDLMLYRIDDQPAVPDGSALRAFAAEGLTCALLATLTVQRRRAGGAWNAAEEGEIFEAAPLVRGAPVFICTHGAFVESEDSEDDGGDVEAHPAYAALTTPPSCCARELDYGNRAYDQSIYMHDSALFENPDDDSDDDDDDDRRWLTFYPYVALIVPRASYSDEFDSDDGIDIDGFVLGCRLSFVVDKDDNINDATHAQLFALVRSLDYSRLS
jgi:hypothetical protein